MKPELYVLIGALGGAIIATIGNIISLWLSKKYEYSKEIKRLVFEFSAKEWANLLEEVHRRSGKTTISPLAHFVIFNSLLSQLIDKKDFDEDDIRKLIDQNNKMSALFDENSKLEEKKT